VRHFEWSPPVTVDVSGYQGTPPGSHTPREVPFWNNLVRTAKKTFWSKKIWQKDWTRGKLWNISRETMGIEKGSMTTNFQSHKVKATRPERSNSYEKAEGRMSETHTLKCMFVRFAVATIISFCSFFLLLFRDYIWRRVPLHRLDEDHSVTGLRKSQAECENEPTNWMHDESAHWMPYESAKWCLGGPSAARSHPTDSKDILIQFRCGDSRSRQGCHVLKASPPLLDCSCSCFQHERVKRLKVSPQLAGSSQNPKNKARRQNQKKIGCSWKSSLDISKGSYNSLSLNTEFTSKYSAQNFHILYSSMSSF